MIIKIKEQSDSYLFNSFQTWEDQEWKSLYSNDFQETIMHNKNLREEISIEGKLYSWRVHYPHWPHIYTNWVTKSQAGDFELFSPYDVSKSKDSLFKNGGFVIVSNPFVIEKQDKISNYIGILKLN